MAKAVERWWLFTLMAIVVISGTCSTIVTKLQDTRESDGSRFNHPYFQTATMFFGELICLSIYLGNKYINPDHSEDLMPRISVQRPPLTGLKARLGVFVFSLPAALDLIASALMMVGLGLTAASVYQMMRGFIVVVVAFYRNVFLRKRIYRHQTVGVVLVFAGIAIVGLESIFMTNDESRNPALGVILILAAQFIGASVLVFEEHFFSDIVVPPLLAVGIEGLSGICYFLILLPVLYFIPCYDISMCSGSGHVEDSLYAFKQLGSDGLLMFTFWASIFCISVFNWSALSVTKNAGSLTRSVVETSRMLFVWVIGLAVGMEQFAYVQLVGFLVLAIGMFIYNEVIVLPFFGLRESVQQNQEEVAKMHVLTSEDNVTYDVSQDDEMQEGLKDEE